MRIRRLSANEKIFQESGKIYKEALKNNRISEEFTYQEGNIPNDKNLYIDKENTKYSQKYKKENYLV